MKRILATALFAALCVSSSLALAQGPGAPTLERSRGPSVSPYLNLLRGGSLGSNYYNLLRPQRDFERFERRAAAAARGLRADLDQQRNDLSDEERRASQLSPSGRAASFMTQGRYFGVGSR